MRTGPGQNPRAQRGTSPRVQQRLHAVHTNPALRSALAARGITPHEFATSSDAQIGWRYDQGTRRLRAQHVARQEAGLVPGFRAPRSLADRFLGDLGTAALYSIPGTIAAVRHPIRAAEAIPGQIASDFRHPLRHPGYTFLDALGAVSLGTGTAARIGAAGRALRAGEGIARAATRKGFEGGSLLHAPEPGTAKLAAGDATVEKPLSRNAAVRARQRRSYRAKQQLLEKQPQSAPEGILRDRAASTLGGRLRTQRRLERAHAQGDLNYLRRATKHLTDAEQAAMRVVAIEGDAALKNPAEVIARHARTHRGFVKQGFSKDTHNALVRDLRRAKGVLENPSERFLRAIDATRALSQHGEEESIARGFLTREAADRRRLNVAKVYNEKLSEAPAGSFYFPLGIARRRGGLGRFYNPRLSETGVGKPQSYRYAPELRRRFTGASLKKGLVPQNVPKAVSESYQRRLTLHSAHDLYETLQKASTATKETATQVPIRATAAISDDLKRLLTAADEHVDLSEEARAQLSAELKRLGEEMFPKEGLLGANLKGVRWVEKGFVKDLANTSDRNAFTKYADAISNPIRFGTLYLRPAYLLNALGNVGMLATEGHLAPQALWDAARAEAKHGTHNVAWIDSMMGSGRALGQAVDQGIFHTLPHKLAEGWNVVTDLHARRAAFLLEARRAGFRTSADIERLRTDPHLASKRNEIAERARTIVGDYENLSPLEANYIRRLIYFYPWLKVATRWTGHQLTEHPVKSALMAQNGRAEARQVSKILSLLPEWARISGLIPLGHGKGDLVRTINPSSINTPASVVQTAVPLAGAAQELAGGHANMGLRDVATPALAALLPDSGAPGRPGGIPGAVMSTPIPSALRRAGVLGPASKTYPEQGLGPAVGPLAAGGLYPRETSRSALAKQAAKERGRETAQAKEQRYRDELIKDSRHAGLAHPPSSVLADAHWKARLDEQIKKGQSWKERAQIAATLMDERYHYGYAARIKFLRTEAQAEELYHAFRSRLFPRYAEWESRAHAIIHRHALQAPAGTAP
jgi:hypothetical protein